MVVFVGGWYLQSLVMEYSLDQSEQVEMLKQQIIQQHKQISDQQLQLEQLNIIIDVLLNKDGKVKNALHLNS